jgi:uncharacterized GH25 family protein
MFVDRLERWRTAEPFQFYSIISVGFRGIEMRTSKMWPTLLTFAVVILARDPLLAHDMWIEPTTFAPDSGDIVGLKLKVGQDLLGDPLARDSQLIKQFIVEDSEGRKPVVGRDGGNPAGFIRASDPGVLVVGYHSNPSTVEETAEKFNQYLKEEGLDSVAALRASRNETNSKVHELFSRCAKSLVFAAPASGAQGDRILGFPLELVAEKNPYALRAGEDLPVRLTYGSHPLAGALVIAMNRKNPTEKLSARTGKDGRVKLPLRPGGMWLVKAVHMVPAPTGTNADWQSYWASLTFQLGQ